MKCIRTVRHSYLLLVLGLSLGCESTVLDHDTRIAAEQATLLDLDRTWSEEAAVGDIEFILTHWTDHAVNFFPGAPPAVGKEAIRKLIRKNRSQPGFDLTWEGTKAFVAHGRDLGYTSGTFKLTVNDTEGHPLTRTGNYVCVWKKQPDGSWKRALGISTFGPPSEE
ncbi:MAG: YybH family protein [Rhodothermales bacterium]